MQGEQTQKSTAVKKHYNLNSLTLAVYLTHNDVKKMHGQAACNTAPFNN